MKAVFKTGIVASSVAAALLLGGQLNLRTATQSQDTSKMFTDLAAQMLTITQAHAAGSETLLQTVRVFYRLGMGMTQAEFNAFKADVPNIDDITGADGLVGKLNTLRKGISNSILANNSSITECQQVPATGQFTDGGATVEFAAPKHEAPTGYPHGGGDDYEKRVEITQVNGTKTIKAVFEFNCNVAASMLAYEFTDSSNAPANHKMAIFYDGEDSSDKRFQFYFDWPTEDVHMAVIMEIEPTLYRSWVSSGKSNGDTGFRMAAIGHLDTGKVSFFADDTTGGGGAGDGDRHTETTVTAINAPDDGVPYQGCADDFDHDYDSTGANPITVNTLCGTDTLSVGAGALPGLTNLSTNKVYDEVEAGIDLLLAP